MYILRPRLNRRTFLKGTGVSIALPMLEAMQPSAISKDKKTPPMRMVCVGNPLGMLPDAFFPVTAGSGYDSAYGGDGNDIVTLAGWANFVDGQAGNDTVVEAGNRNVAGFRYDAALRVRVSSVRVY